MNKRQQKKYIKVNHVQAPPSAYEKHLESALNKLKDIHIQDKISNLFTMFYNLFAYIVNKVFRLKFLVLMGAVAAASIDYFLIMKNFSETYYGLGEPKYIAAGILFILLITEIVLFHKFEYKPSPKPVKRNWRSLDKIDDYEKRLLKWEARENRRVKAHKAKWTLLKTIMGSLFAILIMVNLNFSFGELSATIGKDVNSNNRAEQASALIIGQIEDINTQLKQINTTMNSLDPIEWKTKRGELSLLSSELIKKKESMISELKEVQGDGRKEVIADKPIRYTYDQVKAWFDITMEQYVSIINFLLSLCIVSMYIFLTYTYVVLSASDDTQIVKLKKITRRKR